MGRLSHVLAGLALASLVAGGAAGEAPPIRNGFALEPATVAVAEILEGGPPRDGIPALDRPRFATPAEAGWDDDELVVGLAIGREARAYPLAILVWHELVNDSLGGQPVLVSYCPLCGTALVFDRRVAGSVRRFGVSGLLYRSALLLYDRETESLWSQISAGAVTGASRGQRLRLLRARVTTLGAWRKAQPATSVLTRETGHRRPYGSTPYEGYASSERLLFPVPLDRRYHPKTPTLGLRVPGGAARAYPADELRRAGGGVREHFAGHPVAVSFDPDAVEFRVEAPPEIEVIEAYWFAWAAFHPETSVFRGPEDD